MALPCLVASIHVGQPLPSLVQGMYEDLEKVEKGTRLNRTMGSSSSHGEGISKEQKRQSCLSRQSPAPLFLCMGDDDACTR